MFFLCLFVVNHLVDVFFQPEIKSMVMKYFLYQTESDKVGKEAGDLFPVHAAEPLALVEGNRLVLFQ